MTDCGHSLHGAITTRARARSTKLLARHATGTQQVGQRDDNAVAQVVRLGLVVGLDQEADSHTLLANNGRTVAIWPPPHVVEWWQRKQRPGRTAHTPYSLRFQRAEMTESRSSSCSLSRPCGDSEIAAGAKTLPAHERPRNNGDEIGDASAVDDAVHRGLCRTRPHKTVV